MMISNKIKIKVKRLHKELRKYRYFYYELSDSLISDYDYDMLEKEYDEICDRAGIPKEYRVTNFVGFDIRIPMNPFNMIELNGTNKRSKRKAK